MAAAGGYYAMGHSLDVTASYQLLQPSRGRWAPVVRKMSDTRASLHAAQRNRVERFQGVDFPAAMEFHPTLKGIGELLRPGQDAVNL